MDTPSTLWDALDLDAATPPVVAIVGGGGKTSLLFRLGREAHARRLPAVVTGTTRFTKLSQRGDEIGLLVCEAPGRPPELGPTVAAGATVLVHAGPMAQGRWTPLEPEAVDSIAATPGLGLIAIEADGSKMRPFKAPADHEPVIPQSTTHVVAVVGLRVLDTPLDEGTVHRPERVRAIVGDEPLVTAEVIARVLLAEDGGRKGVGDRSYTVLVNQADLDEERALALGHALRDAGVPRVIVAALQDAASPIRAVLSA
jgi:molybdenum cofactor cytidylyltransferase